MSQKLTGLINASALLLFVTFCCTLIAAETLTPVNKQRTVEIEKQISVESQKRIKRQFGGGFGGGNGDFNNFNNGFGGNFNGNFGGGRRRGQRPRPNNGNGFFPNSNSNNFDGPVFSGGGTNDGLIFSNGRPNNNVGNFAPAATTPASSVNNGQNNSNNGAGNSGQLVFINNRPTIATMAPFTGRTTASPQYLRCFNSCATTSEYNPICGSNQEMYFNEQKFNCAVRCGADIQIVRRGSCSGLFPMERG